MANQNNRRAAILYPGDHQGRENATPDNNRLALIFEAFADLGVSAEPAVYHDDFCEEVRQQLLQVDAVLVWHNPIQDGRDRSILDPMLRDVAEAGVFVSTHPDTILKIGTKEVLYQTRDVGWGSDVRLYRSLEQMRQELPERLVSDEARVLKQYRGNGGNGVWKVALKTKGTQPRPETILRVRHAKKGSIEEEISLDQFFKQCEQYFSGEGRMIDQAYQPRLSEGMVRCYLVLDKVAGFGHQAINALYPAPPGAPPSEAPQPGPRLYHPPTLSEFQSLKRILEEKWVPAMQQALDLDATALPILWDCDFLLGPQDDWGEDTYVLCEINASSIAPFPESAAPYVARATLERLQGME
ncbi:MAG: Cj0069 family protein [Desulfobacterales bacterium]|nr:Cj0069 family protein [Desulfobacterales bacterium]